jgi:GNAT superfamily N-acetyltransferase
LRRQSEYGDVFTQELFDFIREGQGKIYIAVDGQKYVGFIAGAVDKQSDKNLLEVVPTKLGVVSEFFVEEKYRGQGVGKVLMEKLETYFKSIGCDSLWANVVAFNPAHDVYEKMGYHNREIGMLKKL